MKEYYVTHSKYKSNDRKSWENALTFMFDGKIKDVKCGVYNYYHNGELIWSVDGDANLWKDFVDGSYNEKTDYSYDKLKELYPIYGKYSDNCQDFVREDMKKFSGWTITVTNEN